MTEFDFAAAERELSISTPEVTLRERAAMAFTQHHGGRESYLLQATADTLDEILGIGLREAKDPKVTVHRSGYGSVDVVIDNLLFRCEVTEGEGDNEDDCALFMKGPHGTMELIKCLEDVGRMLARGPCYAVRPEADGRGAE